MTYRRGPRTDRALGRLRRYYAYLRSVLSARDTAGLRMAAEAAIQFLQKQINIYADETADPITNDKCKQGRKCLRHRVTTYFYVHV